MRWGSEILYIEATEYEVSMCSKTTKVFGDNAISRRSVSYSDITSVEFKTSGGLMPTFTFEITFPGSASNPFSIGHTVMSGSQAQRMQNDGNSLKRYIEQRVKQARTATVQNSIPNVVMQSSSPVDEIRKYKELLDEGIITQKEFELKKKQLLGVETGESESEDIIDEGIEIAVTNDAKAEMPKNLVVFQMIDKNGANGQGRRFRISSNSSVEFSVEQCQHIEICAVFENNAFSIKRQYTKYLDNNISSFADLYCLGFNAFKLYFDSQLEIGLEILKEYGCEGYTMEKIKMKVGEFYKQKKIFECLQNYYVPVKEINSMLCQYTRDIKGAFCGSAEYLIDINLINKDKKRNAIIRYAEGVYRDKGKTFKVDLVKALDSCVWNIGDFIYEILVEEGKLKPTPFVAGNIIESEVKNIAIKLKERQYNERSAIEKLCLCIQKYPFHLYPYRDIYKLDAASKKSLLKLGDYLGIRGHVEEWVREVDRNRY